MEITLDIDKGILVEAKFRAAEDGIPLERVVEHALRIFLGETPHPAPYEFTFPVVGGGPPLVDVADRDALYEFLDEGRWDGGDDSASGETPGSVPQ